MQTQSVMTIFFNLDPIDVPFIKNSLTSTSLLISDEKTKIPKLSGTAFLSIVVFNVKRIYNNMFVKNIDFNTSDTTLSVNETNIEKYILENIHFSDASIIFFPVYSSSGPIWITTGKILEELKCKFLFSVHELQDTDIYLSPDIGLNRSNALDIGNYQFKVKFKGPLITHEQWEQNEDFKGIINRIAIVTEPRFYSIIANNLFAQSSIIIDDKTWKIEGINNQNKRSIPKATFFKNEIELEDFENTQYLFSGDKDINNIFSPKYWKSALDMIIAGIKALEYINTQSLPLSQFKIKLLTINSLT